VRRSPTRPTAACPGRDVVLFTTSMLLANLLRGNRFTSVTKELSPGELPAALDPFTLRFKAEAEPVRVST
jgi:hypothetical protein